LTAYNPVAVIHLAASAYVGDSVRNPLHYYQNNVSNVISLVKMLEECRINKIVFSSSCATYGIPETVPIPECHPLNPINPYGSSKMMAERILSDVDAAYGIRSVSLRFFNAAGADPHAKIGELHVPETHLIPLILNTALGRQKSVEVLGSDHATPDGTCIRDYVHVCDLADAHVLALQWLLDGKPTRIFNLSSGAGYSVLDVITAAERVTGRSISRVVLPSRKGDPPMLVGDARQARQCLLWEPKRACIEMQIEDAWRWHVRCFKSLSQ
jgi:UDP-glucose 4-epimerase